MLDFSCAVAILIFVMGNFEQLKEDLQEKIMQWHDGLESNHAYPHLEKIICDHGHAPNAWNDMDKLCDIVCETINDFPRG
jgi:hypothetical protein